MPSSRMSLPAASMTSRAFRLGSMSPSNIVSITSLAISSFSFAVSRITVGVLLLYFFVSDSEVPRRWMAKVLSESCSGVARGVCSTGPPMRGPTESTGPPPACVQPGDTTGVSITTGSPPNGECSGGARFCVWVKRVSTTTTLLSLRCGRTASALCASSSRTSSRVSSTRSTFAISAAAAACSLHHSVHCPLENDDVLSLRDQGKLRGSRHERRRRTEQGGAGDCATRQAGDHQPRPERRLASSQRQHLLS
mmetsp:Transcript_36824/g.93348  ORF Transcript_36824/g.93348 Transcript_36824/m.93348 type:complete len:251 (+) Transcript_36824:186-938(+)